MNQPNDKVAFTMVIDNSRATIINVLLNAAQLDPNIQAGVNQALQKNGIDIQTEFIDEFTQKFHEYGFCKDPNCNYPN